MAADADPRRAGPDRRPPPAPVLPGADGAGHRNGLVPLLEQAFEHDSLYALRAAVAAHGGRAGLPQRRVEDLVIAAHELAANAVRHGAGHGRLRLWIHHEVLYCEVADSGPDPQADRESHQAMLLHGEPGHGLWLVRQVTDEAVLRSGPDGTTATITFSLAGAASESVP